MIDDPRIVAALMDEMKDYLPIPAQPSPDLVRLLRDKGLKISIGKTVMIKEVFYSGDEGGIVCDVTPTPPAKEAIVVSLTHLRVPPRHPISRAIRQYQRQRIRHLARTA